MSAQQNGVMNLTVEESIAMDDPNAAEDEDAEMYDDSLEDPATYAAANGVAPPLHNMFALLVGVEHYPEVVRPEGWVPPADDDNTTTPSHWPRNMNEEEPLLDPTGALADVQNVYDYLTGERGVPAEHIVVLRDGEATRANILRAFRGHLIENKAIKRGDPILYHYSGHGTRGPAPEGWAGAGDGEQYIEYIVPHDSVAFGQMGKPGIPDRTTRALLAELAREKGRNVTVIFDCCNSAHGTRKAGPSKRTYRARGIRPIFVGKTTADTDREIWGKSLPVPTASPTLSSTGSGVRERDTQDLDDTHVLLAGCSRMEASNGNEEGGVFTRFLLQALREGRARTYAELMLRTRQLLAGFYRELDGYYRSFDPPVPAEDRLEHQSPQCEGTGRDRQLFSAALADARTFAVHPHPHEPALCVVDGAGAPLGVRVGTVFELQYAPPGEAARSVLGTAVATEVEPKHTVVRLPVGVVLPADGNVRATLSKLSDPVTLAVVNLAPDSEAANIAYGTLQMRLAQPSQHFKFVPPEKAELVLQVDARYVRFHRQDIRLGALGTPDPLLRHSDIKNVFPGALARIAHFNYYLSLEGSGAAGHPLAGDVAVELHRLAPPAEDYTSDDFTFSDVYLNPAPGGEVPFERGEEAVIRHDGDDELYALVLKNSGSRALHAYVLLLDPSTYGIELFAQPVNASEPVLPPLGEVQIGRSAACEGAMWFDVGPDGAKDTGFLKVVLATEGDLNLKYMAQDPVLGYHPDSDQVNYVEERQVGRSPGATAQPMKGAWDVITRKLTVVPA